MILVIFFLYFKRFFFFFFYICSEVLVDLLRVPIIICDTLHTFVMNFGVLKLFDWRVMFIPWHIIFTLAIIEPSEQSKQLVRF